MGTVDALGDGIPVAAAVPVPEERPTANISSSSSLAVPVAQHYADNPSSNNENVAVALVPAEETVYLMGLGYEPKEITCPFCEHQGVTSIRSTVDLFTITAVVIIFLVFWPLFWIPLVAPGCKVTEHFCTHCHRKVRACVCIGYVYVACVVTSKMVRTHVLASAPPFKILGWFGSGLCRRMRMLWVLILSLHTAHREKKKDSV